MISENRLDGIARRRAVLDAWPFTPTFPPKTWAISRRLRPGRAAVLQGHRRGRRELQLPGPHRHRPLHPDALREARGGRRRAVLPGADGASGGARHHLPAAGEGPQRRHARHAVRPARRHRHLPRRHVDAPPGRRPLRRGRRSAGAHASRRRRLFRQAAQRALGRGLAAAVRAGGTRAPTSVQHGMRATIETELGHSKGAGRATCRRA